MTKTQIPGDRVIGDSGRRSLVVRAMDVLALGVVAILLLDRPLAVGLRELPVDLSLTIFGVVPDLAKSSFYMFLCFAVLVGYRLLSGDHARSEKALYVIGAAALSGLCADALSVVFGRAHPEALMAGGALGFGFFNRGPEFDSFPSGHAAVVAGLAGALSILWPTTRTVLMSVAAIIASVKIINGTNYFSDVLCGFALGLGMSSMLVIVFERSGIRFTT